MTFTYNGALDTDVKKVRFLLGDTVSASAVFTDEELTYLVSANGTLIDAAIGGVDALMARHAPSSLTRTVGDLSIQYGGRIQNLESLRRSLMMQRAKNSRLGIYSAGHQVGEKEALAANTALVPPLFRRKMFEAPQVIDPVVENHR